MLEGMVVVLIVALALAIVGRFLYRNWAGEDACSSACGSCADHVAIGPRQEQDPGPRTPVERAEPHSHCRSKERDR